MTKAHDERSLTRREFGMLSAGALAAPLAGCSAPELSTAPASGTRRDGLNIVFLFTDQERYMPKWPTGLSLPAHERMQHTDHRASPAQGGLLHGL